MVQYVTKLAIKWPMKMLLGAALCVSHRYFMQLIDFLQFERILEQGLLLLI